MSRTKMQAGPLSGFKMLDFSSLLPGAYCSLHLADMGMEVLKIEKPNREGLKGEGEAARNEDKGHFFALNRNKRSITLNLKAEEGKEIFYRLIGSYDIVLETFRPGVVDRLGIGYTELKKRNPRVIFCSLSGYGQYGPYRQRSGHDINYIALGGILGLTGARNGPPVIPGVQIADIGGGALMAAIGILAAVIHRERTGEGQFLDISMLDGVISWLSIHAGRYFADGALPKRGEMLLSGGYACYQVYQTKDGRYMSLGALEKKFWENFCEAIGRRDLIQRQFAAGEEQLLLIEEMRKVFEARTQKEWIESLKDVDACCEPILSLDEAFDHPQAVHRQMTTEVKHPVEGWVEQIGNPIKSSRFSFDIRTPPPALGEDTAEVLKGIGYSDEQIAHLKEARTI